MMNRKQKVGDCRIKGIMSRKTQLKMFLSWAVPAICTIASAETPAYSFGVATATHPASSSSLLRAEDDKSYNRLLQEAAEVQTVVALEVDEDDHDHDEEEHDDHKDELVVVSSSHHMNSYFRHA